MRVAGAKSGEVSDRVRGVACTTDSARHGV